MRWPTGDYRIVYPSENNPMGYYYRARVVNEGRTFFSKKEWVCHIDRYFMDWEPHDKMRFLTEEEAIAAGNRRLDSLEGSLPGKRL